MMLPRSIFTASLVVISHARGDKQSHDDVFSPRQHGELVFVSSSGELDSVSSLTFDEEEMIFSMGKFRARSFSGDSIDFHGHEIINAALVNPSVEGLQHLTLDTLAIKSQVSTGKNGVGLAMIDNDGTISTTGHLRWDENTKALKLSSLQALGPTGLEIDSDVDLKSRTLTNVKISPGTVLNQLTFQDGTIENSVLNNVTVTGLNLGEVRMISLSISKFDSNHGAIVMVGENGEFEASSSLKQEKNGHLLVNSQVILSKPLDLNGEQILNAKIASGSIDGPIDISANFINAKGVSIIDIREDKTVTSDGLAVLGLDGKLQMGSISIDKDGNLGDFRVRGTIDFNGNDLYPRGRVRGADILGGSIAELEKLQVNGNTDLRSGLQVSGETYIDGALTVAGSVLGSGPYVDVSDKRFKRNIEKINSPDALKRILLLEGVSYELDFSDMFPSNRFGNKGDNDAPSRRQIGFIAQDVEKVLPELVYNDKEDFKGIQYSRLIPILVEGLKQMSTELQELRETVSQLAEELNGLKFALGGGRPYSPMTEPR